MFCFCPPLQFSYSCLSVQTNYAKQVQAGTGRLWSGKYKMVMFLNMLVVLEFIDTIEEKISIEQVWRSINDVLVAALIW